MGLEHWLLMAIHTLEPWVTMAELDKVRGHVEDRLIEDVHSRPVVAASHEASGFLGD